MRVTAGEGGWWGLHEVLLLMEACVCVLLNKYILIFCNFIQGKTPQRHFHLSPSRYANFSMSLSLLSARPAIKNIYE